MRKNLYQVDVNIPAFMESIRLSVPEFKEAEFKRIIESGNLSDLLKIKEFEQELRASLEQTMSMLIEECLNGGCEQAVSIEDVSDELEAMVAYPEFR